MIANAIFVKIFWHLNVTQPFMCFRVNQVYVFLSQSNIFISSSRWIFISSRWVWLYSWWVFFSPRGKFTTRSHPGKVLKIWYFPRWAKQSLPGYWDRVSNRWQRTKKNKSFSKWTELSQSVPQGSVLGSPLFNINLNDLFFLVNYTKVYNFAYSNTIFACDTFFAM